LGAADRPTKHNTNTIHCSAHIQEATAATEKMNKGKRDRERERERE
jgi:hypothetical protein